MARAGERSAVRALIPDETWRELKRIAASQGLATSVAVAHAVDAWLRTNQPEQGGSASALRDRQRKTK
jgi:hypothetical protein